MVETNNLVVISDTHSGCRLALVPPQGVKLDDGGDYATHSVRGACIAAIGLIERDGTTLDLSKPDRVAMLAAMVSGSVLTAGEQAEIEALGTVNISRADELGLGIVSTAHVATARA